MSDAGNTITTTTPGTLSATVQVPLKRIAIIGTAQSWTYCPWQDKTLAVAALNDCYALGLPRADVWFDLHPFNEMVFVERNASRTVDASQIPVGSYVRPQQHLEWLRTRPFPVFLQQAPIGWSNARTFPVEQVLAWWQKFWPYRVDWKGSVSQGRDYEGSTPCWMLMWAIMEGFTEIHIYGIHLATEWEYVEQRPNMEFILGAASALGVKIVLPTTTPICQGKFRYAYEPKADLPVQRHLSTIHRVKAEGARLQQARQQTRWWQRGRRQDLTAQVARKDMELVDAKTEMAKAKLRLMVMT